MGRHRYGGYHGRDTARTVVRAVVALVVVLLLLAAAALIFGQRYITYTDDGVRLGRPIFQRGEKPSSEPSVDPELVQLPRPEPEEQPEEKPSAS